MNVLRVGLGGAGGTYGDRSPVISLDQKLKLYIESSINGYTSYMGFNALWGPPAIPMNEWTNVQVSQLQLSDGPYQFTVRIAGTIFYQVINQNPMAFENVYVYASGNFYPAALARIDNFVINTFPGGPTGERGFRVVQGYLHQTLPVLYKQWYISLDFKPLGTSHERTNLLHIGRAGNWRVEESDKDRKYGDRSPGIWIEGYNQLFIASSINGISSYSDWGLTRSNPLNTWAKLEISQLRQEDGSYQFTITLNG